MWRFPSCACRLVCRREGSAFLNVLLARHRQPTVPILRDNLRMPNEKWPGIIRSRAFALRRSEYFLGARARADHEGVVSVLRHLPPQVFVIAEGHDRVPDLL